MTMRWNAAWAGAARQAAASSVSNRAVGRTRSAPDPSVERSYDTMDSSSPSDGKPRLDRKSGVLIRDPGGRKVYAAVTVHGSPTGGNRSPAELSEKLGI